MPDLTLICPDCGGAIQHICGAQSALQSDANPDANGEIARVSEFLDLNPATKRARVYNQGYDQDFLTFWKAYPRKKNKRTAQIEWRKAVTRVSANPGSNREIAKAQILAGAIRWREDPNRLDQFTEYAERWLRADGWENEPEPARLPPGTLPAIGLPESQEDIDAKIATYLGGET